MRSAQSLALLDIHLRRFEQKPSGEDGLSLARPLRERYKMGIMILTSARAVVEKRNQSTTWEHRFWEHGIRDPTDCNRPIHYLHWNPVQHGDAQRVNDWPDSSLPRYVK